MQKKSYRFEILFMLGFLFTLIAAFGTFFLGFKMGINQTEAKYAHLSNHSGFETTASYEQQDLAAYYYVVFQPYQQFKDDYFDLVDQLSRSDSRLKSIGIMKEIREAASRQYDQIQSHSITVSSPLLKDAQTDVLKSLKLFDESADRIEIGSKNGAELVKSLANDEFTKNAEKYGLKAQQKYYTSMMKWASKSNKSIPADFSFRDNITVKEWTNFPLAVKNKIVSDIMTSSNLYVSYLPQDMTAKIDQMIDSGKASSMKLNSLVSIVNVLMDTEAVQGKEFLRWKSTYYASESIPELPFFTEQ
ncbi:hypothetical protein [Paenibacillus lentus]|uniref:Uncharacterized protein n=1 Tax=Paenibacillus lentus TaxID=1338368 RepID=A0A3S8RWS6_9BACL|nr:hypothetical protein [Paenibacillus lentus]AZK47147.1 hypothetical protein EIM92_14060 [Paenibacillus lentus]